MTEYAGYLVTLERDISATITPSWQVVAQIRDLNGPAAQSDQIEVSHRDDIWRRYVSGMKDGGEVAFDVIFDPDHASHDPTLTTSMWGWLDDGVRKSFRITFPGDDGDTTTATFLAFVSNFEIASPMEAGLGANLTLKISGSVTWAHVSA